MENERWISLASIQHCKNERLFCWEEFDFNHKGLGIFATTEHSPGLMLPYGGIEIFVREFDELMNGDQIRLSYMVNGRFDRSKRLKSWLGALVETTDVPPYLFLQHHDVHATILVQIYNFDMFGRLRSEYSVQYSTG